MDVRCDRCETEYELDDAIVTDAGASVQCTTCGHTFVVSRQAPAAVPAATRPVGPTPSAGTTDPGPKVPEWTLSTDDGKVHRFRDLNVLQKWIVERKVTRTERISRLGGPWLSLGDVVELAPFFAVVDEADRARAALPVASSPPISSRPPPGMIPPGASRGSGPARTTGSPAPNPNPILTSATEDRGRVSEDGPTVPNRRLPDMIPPEAVPPRAAPRTPSQPAATLKEGIRPPEERTPTARTTANDPVAAARAAAAGPRASARTELVFGSTTAEARLLDSDLLEERHTGRNIAIAAVILLAAGGAGAWWYTQRGPGAGSPPVASREAPRPAEPAAPAATSPGKGAPIVAETSRLEAAKARPAPPPAAGAGGASPEVRAPAAASGEASTVAGANAGTPAARGRGGAKPARAPAEAVAAAVRPGSYDQLVREADRLLESGKSAKAEKLYAQALAARPDGVAAITGSAYVLLDRQRHFKAIETFRSALAIQPAYGPALFGIAESYRARGDTAQALGAYRQYLAVAPTGTDAPAARRQIKDLESAAPAPAADRASGPPDSDP